jgi:replicative DNA helicase
MAEWIVIKALYTNPDHLVHVAEQVNDMDFTYRPFRIIYSAIKHLVANNTTVNAESIMALLQARAPNNYNEIMAIGGAKAIETLYDPTYKSLTNLDEHIKSIVDRSAQVQVYVASNRLVDNIKAGKSYDDALNEFEQAIQSVKLKGRKSNIDRIGDDLDDLFGRIIAQDESVLGMSIEHKFPQLNGMLKRIQPNRVTVILSNYKSGKSSLLLELGWTLAESGHPVLFGDTELYKDEFQIRLLSKITGLAMDYIQEGRWANNDYEIRLLQGAKEKIRAAPFYWVNVNHMSRSEIAALVKLAQLKYGIKAFVYDYIKSDNDKTEGRIDKQIAAKVDMLKEDIAKTCNIAVLSAVQLNDSTGRVSDSKDVYRLADNVVLLRKVEQDDPEFQKCATHVLIMDTSRYTAAGQRVPLTIDFARQMVAETI